VLSNHDVSGRALILLSTGLIGLTGGAPYGQGAEAQLDGRGRAFFEERIRPVFIENCYPCHSERAGKTEGGLALDSRDGLSRGGTNGAVLVPFAPERSRILEALRRTNPKLRMPPKKILAPALIKDMEAWIRMGAPYPPRDDALPSRDGRTVKPWSFQPIANPPIPSVRQAAWPKQPIDHFILAALEQKGLAPAAPADPATLLRRLSFDLIGLPPTSAETSAFVADHSPEAIARVVDGLLESPHFGEHWARDWLELVGYADASGVDSSSLSENAWRYRDYVVQALNRDKPYGAFIHEQLAGDLMPDSNDELMRQRLVATGFLVVGLRTEFEPRPGKLAMDIANAQIDLTTRTFLGLSVSCARCHDHKTDPITLRDYYALAGIFTSTATMAGLGEEARRGPPHAMQRSLATPTQLRELSLYTERFDKLREQLKEAREMKMEFPGEVDSARLSGVVVDNLAAEIKGAWKESSYSTNFVDRNYLHDGNADKGKKTARFVPDLPMDGTYEVLVSYTPRANRATNVPVTIAAVGGTKTVFVDQTKAPTIDKVFVSLGRFPLKGGTNSSVLISNEGTKGFVVVDAVRFVPAGNGKTAQAASAETDPEAALLNYHQLEKEVREMQMKRPVLPQALAVEDGQIHDCRLRLHGDPNALGDDVPRGFLAALGAPDSTAYAVTDESSGRLELANWIANRSNPLTARVAVNRVWQHLFGKGLVETADDFGNEGAKPSHPELLDYLSWHFMEQGGSFKKLIRSLVLSSTYQMSSAPSGPPSDPSNRLLSRMNQRLLAPEVLRDAVLALSGELDPKVGGDWQMSEDETVPTLEDARNVQLSSRRRTLYLPVLPGQPPAIFDLFKQRPSKPQATNSPGSSVRRGALAERELAAWERRYRELIGSNEFELLR
jgi:hypothetical protein